MNSHYELTDAEFESAFESASLDPVLFSHEAHLRLAWIHINKYGVDAAIENIRSQISAYTKSLGADDKYHETLTIVGVRAVHHFMLRSKTTDFKAFIQENTKLMNQFKDLVDSHYHQDIFTSDLARTVFIEPDKEPFN